MTQFPLQNHCLGINIQLRSYMLTFIKGLIVMGNPILWLYHLTRNEFLCIPNVIRYFLLNWLFLTLYGLAIGGYYTLNVMHVGDTL